MNYKRAAIVPLLLLIAVVQTSLAPSSAHASVPTHEWSLSGPLPGITPSAGISAKEVSFLSNPLSIFSVSWDSIAWYFVKVILHEFSEGIVTWIRTGQDPFFSGGTEGSLFVTNIDEFLLDAADNAAGVMLSEYFGDAYDALCEPFRLPVGLGLSHGYGRDYGSFRFQARCSITDIVANVEDFYEDFSNGGWEAWFASALYENNPLGLLTIARETSREREARAVSANKSDFLAGLGFPGLRECPPENQIPGPTQNGKPLCKNNGYITKTPGKAIEDQVANVYGNEIRSLEVADEIDEILFAAFQSLLSWALSGGGSDGLLGSDISRNKLPDHLGCNVSTGKPAGCACTTNTQCASNQCTAGKCDSGTGTTPQCSDGKDNDADGKIDFGTGPTNDPGCSSLTDTSEADGGAGIPRPPRDDPPRPPGH